MSCTNGVGLAGKLLFALFGEVLLYSEVNNRKILKAMEQVFRTMGSAAAPAETMAASGSTTEFASEMAELLESGFTDVEQNARVLQETGGDVQQALELLIALRESLSGGE